MTSLSIGRLRAPIALLEAPKAEKAAQSTTNKKNTSHIVHDAWFQQEDGVVAAPRKKTYAWKSSPHADWFPQKGEIAASNEDMIIEMISEMIRAYPPFYDWRQQQKEIQEAIAPILRRLRHLPHDYWIEQQTRLLREKPLSMVDRFKETTLDHCLSFLENRELLEIVTTCKAFAKVGTRWINKSVLTSAYKKQLALMENPREALRKVKNVYIRNCVVVLEKAPQDCNYRRLSSKQVEQLKIAYLTPGSFKVVISKLMEEVLKFPPHSSIELELFNQTSRILHNVDLTEFFTGKLVKLDHGYAHIIKAFDTGLDERGHHLFVFQSVDVATISEQEKAEAFSSNMKLGDFISDAAVAVFKAEHNHSMSSMYGCGALYLIPSGLTLETRKLAHHLLLMRGADENLIFVNDDKDKILEASAPKAT